MRFFSSKKKQVTSLLNTSKERTRPVFHTLKVKDIRNETDESVSVAFDLPESLRTQYAFLPGQYLTLRTNIKGEDVRRSYSICSCPFNEDLRVAIKKLEGGLFSTYANEQLRIGDELQVMTPEGSFTTDVKENQVKTYVAFAAGSGITPIMSLMKTILEVEKNSQFILFYGNRTSNSIIFRDEIDALKNTYMNRLRVSHILSREDQGSDATRGHIDASKVKVFSERFFDVKEVSEFFICGPEQMIHAVKDTLIEIGAPKDRVRFELFTTGAVTAETPKAQAREASKTDTSKVTVILDGEETHFDLAYHGNTITDAATHAGADVPFSCKGAVCCTCRARVIKGEVEMDMNYALEPEEVEDGYVLTCQTHPRSPEVVISFDE
jgi:ring-1,2-phenylacetyl-CoA epoxidase subunit PaaE